MGSRPPCPRIIRTAGPGGHPARPRRGWGNKRRTGRANAGNPGVPYRLDSSLAALHEAIAAIAAAAEDPQVEAIFENIERVKEQNADFANRLATCLGLLREAKANGIPAMFARLEEDLREAQAAEVQGDADSELISLRSCVRVRACGVR